MRWRPSQLLPRRRWKRVLAVALPLLVAAWFGVPQLFVPTIRAKLQGMIAGHLDARLQIGRLMYSPPFGVRARDVRLVSDARLPGWSGAVELLRVKKLDLKLARLPFRHGPLVIQNITVADPEVHLIRTEDGRLVGIHSFLKDDAAATQPLTAPPTRAATRPSDRIKFENPEEAAREAARAKLSDMFELRHFGINAGRIVYEDRSAPGLPPVVWKDLDVGMETAPQSKAVYGYKLAASNRDLAKLGSTGSFDLDALVVQVVDLHVEARAAYSDEQSPLPAQVQRALRDYRVRGRVTVDAAGVFPARDPGASTYHATVGLDDASGYWPKRDAGLDRLSLKLSADQRKPGLVRLTIAALDAASGDTTLRLDKAEVLLDGDAGTWGLAEVAGRVELGADGAGLPKQSRPLLAGMDASGRVDFTVAANGRLLPGENGELVAPQDVVLLAYPRGVTFRPPEWPEPIRNLGGGSVRKDRGGRVLMFQDLTFDYGGDRVELTSARVPLPDDVRTLKQEMRLEEISGTIDFHSPGPRYPGGFGKVVEALRPAGPFVVGRDSWYALDFVPSLGRKADHFFSVSTDAGSFTLTDKRIELTKVSGDATVSNMLIDVRRLQANVLGGRVSGAMKVTPGAVTNYSGMAYARGIDLSVLSRRLGVSESRDSKLSGVGNLDMQFSLAKPKDQPDSVLSHLRAAGEFEVLRGDFWTIPVLGDVAGRVGGRDADRREGLGTVGEAAGVFDIAEGKLLLKSAAVSSPALGLVGSGTIGLTGDKPLDLRVVAAPLGDWRDKARQTHVPILSDVAGEVFGAAQRLVNTATSTLLYEFRVTGTVNERKVATVPVPALTEPAAVLFGRMLRSDNDRRLLEAMKGRQSKRPAEK